MKELKEIMEFIVNNSALITSCILLLLSVVQIIRKNISWENKVTLIINALKDEKKMLVDGKVFKPETLVKIHEVGEKIGATKKEIEQAKAEINKHDNFDNKGIKVGTHNGRPIYLRDGLNLFNKLKNIF